jgi:hypothetical protein
MRGLIILAFIVLVACNRQSPHESNTQAPATTAKAGPPAPEVGQSAEPGVVESKVVPPANAPVDAAVATMSPYRRREYERGYRDCISGNFDAERQGESYRIGCMAAENAKSAVQP